MSQIKDYVPREDGKIKHIYPNNSGNEELRGIIKELVKLTESLSKGLDFDDEINQYKACRICGANVGEGDHYEGCPVSEARRLKYYISRKFGIQFSEEK